MDEEYYITVGKGLNWLSELMKTKKQPAIGIIAIPTKQLLEGNVLDGLKKTDHGALIIKKLFELILVL